MTEFIKKYQGYLTGVMQWDDLTLLWQRIREQQGSGWYVYAVGEDIPVSPASEKQLIRFIGAIDELLRKQHEHDYCGIVYVDDANDPGLVKIYDPNNLGVVCGFSDNPPLPGWILSHARPVDLKQAFPPTASRQRWWQTIFS